MAKLRDEIKKLKNESDIKDFLENNYDKRCWTSAYHYTNLFSLYKILIGNSIKFSRLSNTNDVMEFDFLSKIEDYFFCLSMGKTNDFENYGMYGHLNDKIPKESVEEYAKHIGVKIYFPKQKLIKFVKENDLSLRAIGYTSFIYSPDNKVFIFSHNTKTILHYPKKLEGYLKDRAWSYEKELRICIDKQKALKCMNDGDVLIQLGDLINHIKVYPSPLYTPEECKKVLVKLSGNKKLYEKEIFEKNHYYGQFNNHNNKLHPVQITPR